MATHQRNASSTSDDVPHSRPAAIAGVPGDVVNRDRLSALGMQDHNGLGTQMPHRSPTEQNQLPYGTTDSQQNMTNPNRIEHRALNGIGAQFQGHQPLQNGQKLMNHITRDAGQHHGHSVSLPRSEMSPGVVQDPRYSYSGPLTRFLLETPTQQPPFLVDRSNGQPSSRGGYWLRSSTSKN